MASTYMRSFRQNAEADRDKRINEATFQYSMEEDRLKSQFQNKEAYSSNLKRTIIGCLVVGVILMFIYSKVMILFSIPAAFLVRLIGFCIHNGIVKSHNNSIHLAIADNHRKLSEECETYKNECTRKIKEEEDLYKARVGRARHDFGGSTVLTPIVNWLMKQLEFSIKAADRGIYIYTIKAQLCFEVGISEIWTKALNPHSNVYTNLNMFSYKKNGLVHYKDIPDFFERVGFAQALTKQMQFEVAKRFPLDPIAPMRGASPKLLIDYDDCFMKVTYQVPNPRYQAPVSAKQGINNV